jgi:hypothetical protein
MMNRGLFVGFDACYRHYMVIEQTREESKPQVVEVGRFPVDDKRALVLSFEERPTVPSWAETLALGKKWMRFFQELGI